MVRWEYGIRQWQFSKIEGGYAPEFVGFENEKKAREAFDAMRVSDENPLFELVRRRTTRNLVLDEQILELKH